MLRLFFFCLIFCVVPQTSFTCWNISDNINEPVFLITSLHMNITAEKCCKCMENLFHVVISINPLTLESDWLLISPDGITLESSTKVTRIKERINKALCQYQRKCKENSLEIMNIDIKFRPLFHDVSFLGGRGHWWRNNRGELRRDRTRVSQGRCSKTL